jgi:hypothetical protein
VTSIVVHDTANIRFGDKLLIGGDSAIVCWVDRVDSRVVLWPVRWWSRVIVGVCRFVWNVVMRCVGWVRV